MRIQYWIVTGIVAIAFTAGSQAWAKPQAAQAKQKPPAAAAKTPVKQTEEKEENEQAKSYKITVELPAAVQAAFKKSYPTATIRGTAKETENGKTVYEVESLDKGMARDLIYNPDGTVVEMEEAMSQADLPAPVTAALQKMHPKATITVAEKVTKGTSVQYDLQIKGGKTPTVAFFPDGKPVPPEKEPAEKEPVKK